MFFCILPLFIILYIPPKVDKTNAELNKARMSGHFWSMLQNWHTAWNWSQGTGCAFNATKWDTVLNPALNKIRITKTEHFVRVITKCSSRSCFRKKYCAYELLPIVGYYYPSVRVLKIHITTAYCMIGQMVQKMLVNTREVAFNQRSIIWLQQVL